MQAEPTRAYVYQTDAIDPSDPYPLRIHGIAGPGADEYEGQRLTRAEAEAIVESINQIHRQTEDAELRDARARRAAQR